MFASTPSTAAEPGASPTLIHVAVGVVTDSSGRILISQRPAHAHQGGLWEFPGGKVEAGETVCEALDRELQEELGIRPQRASRLLRVPHDYGDKRVLLDIWRLQGFTGSPHGREQQPVRWVAPAELHAYRFPAANRPIVRALTLPDQYLITPDPARMDEVAFLGRLEQRLASGVRLVQFRAHGLDESAYRKLALRIAGLTRAHGAQLLLNAAPEVALDLGVGLHLSSRRLRTLGRRPAPESMLVAASCHDAEELALASRLRLDFAVLGPVAPTATHPGAAGLGIQRFAELIHDCPMPVYALGGMDKHWLDPVKTARGQGIAAIRALWSP